MQLFPLSHLCDVLLQFEAGCNLGILIRDVMMKGGEMGEAPSIRPVRSWMAAAPRLPENLKKSSALLTLWRRAWGGGMMYTNGDLIITDIENQMKRGDPR